jgi:glutathionylspermidine synthase
MIRKQIAPRPDWQRRVEEHGLIWHSPYGQPYWNEGVYYSFTAAEIEQITEATANLYQLFLRAGDAMLGYRDFYWLRQMGIPEYLFPAIRTSWDSRASSAQLRPLRLRLRRQRRSQAVRVQLRHAHVSA